jgi:Na+/H+ antiporter NhaD/arsenite permease-like protein
VGGLDFWPFLLACGPPALAGLAITYGVVRWRWRGRLELDATLGAPAMQHGGLDRAGLAKAAVATLVLLAFFATDLPHVTGVLMVTGALLVSRHLATRQILGLVDWHLLVLFAGLFVVTHAFGATGLPAHALAALAAYDLQPDRLLVLAPITLVGASAIGNVPLVVLLLAVVPDLSEGALYALAVLSTLAGNLLIVGSLANIIAIERAASAGVRVSFLEHAGCGVLITLVSLTLALLWLAGMGYIRP